MDNFKAVYKILSSLEKAMDLPNFDIEQISAEKLGVSKERFARYLEMMTDVGYIKIALLYFTKIAFICCQNATFL